MNYTRPMPPDEMRQSGLVMVRSEEVESVIRNDFTGRGGLFWDPEHGHLGRARIGVLWMGSKHIHRGSAKMGTMELVAPFDAEPSTWGEAQKRLMLYMLFDQREWPHFIMRLSGPRCHKAEDREFFALVDHEVCHGAQATDQWGAPRFSDTTGEPVWKIRPHDYEGFAGTTERFGAIADGSAGIVLAGAKKPRFHWLPGKDLDVAKACGVQ